MFWTIRKFLSELAVSEEPEVMIHNQKQLAEAALMYHVIAVDGIVEDVERERMSEILGQRFDLDNDDSHDLLESAKLAEAEAIDLYRFTTILKNALDEEERIAIIEGLWEMVFADGVIHELEDNVVWRVSELLGVDTRDRMAQKRKVWKRQSGETPDE